MKARFQLDPEVTGSRLIVPEPYDASEQHFAASLEQAATHAPHSFVVDENPAIGPQLESENSGAVPTPATRHDGHVLDQQPWPFAAHPEENSKQLAATSEGNADLSRASGKDWRNEVAAKVNRYRARTRLRTPRYPSLQLKFDALDSAPPVRPRPSTRNVSAMAHEEAVAQETHPLEIEPEPFRQEPPLRTVPSPATGKILEFPAPFEPAPPPVDELAGPVLDRPRILEVPEVMPPPPALGGILIDPEEPQLLEKRQGFELPLIAAPFGRRMLAAGTDALIVAAAVALFCYTFLRMTAVAPPVHEWAGIAGALFAIFWAGYQYLLLVHTPATPGLKLAGLHLSRFDGTGVPCELRRWRVLASLLSGLSLGLGYAWCFLDEDQLCWHDRITHTYMAPCASEEDRGGISLSLR